MKQPNFFAAGSPYLQHPLLTEERTRSEIDFILSQLALPKGARILDLGCGFGRHSIELARRGFAVTGIDSSGAMIAAAQERAHDTVVSVTFQQIPAEDFITAEKFDVALCLFTTLGQISDEHDNRGLLTAVYKTLKPGGSLVVEVPQRDTAAAQLKPSEQFGSGEWYTAVRKHYDSRSHIVTENFLVVTPENRQEFLLRYRLFSFSELATLFTDAGFSITGAYDGYTAVPLTGDSATMLLVGQK